MAATGVHQNASTRVQLAVVVWSKEDQRFVWGLGDDGVRRVPLVAIRAAREEQGLRIEFLGFTDT